MKQVKDINRKNYIIRTHTHTQQQQQQRATEAGAATPGLLEELRGSNSPD